MKKLIGIFDQNSMTSKQIFKKVIEIANARDMLRKSKRKNKEIVNKS